MLLCDEPTGDLDRTAADNVLELLTLLATDRGTTILMVTHDPRAADRAHRQLHLDKGVLVDAPEAALQEARP
jgi:putative ABC transport system ATP-binding protein